MLGLGPQVLGLGPQVLKRLMVLRALGQLRAARALALAELGGVLDLDLDLDLALA